MPRAAPEGECGPWQSPAPFQAFQHRSLTFLFDATRFRITHTQFHIHTLESVTRAHAHADYQILYYLQGRGREWVGDRDYAIGPQTVLFVPPRQVHRFEATEGSRAQVFTLLFELELNAAQSAGADADEAGFDRLARLLYSGALASLVLQGEAARRGTSIVRDIQQELALGEFGYLLAVKGYLLLLLRLLLQAAVRAAPESTPLTRAQRVVLQATRQMQRRLEEPLTLQAVAASCHVSPSYLQKLLRRQLGLSYSQYLQSARLAQAEYLLRSSSLSVKEVAAAVGIPDANYFSRVFRKCHGCSPRAFRQQGGARPV